MRKQILVRCLVIVAGIMFHLPIALPESHEVLSSASESLLERARELNGSAERLRAEGRYLESEPLYREALDLFRQVNREEDPNTAGVLNNLAELYRIQNRWEEANRLYQESLFIFEKTLGAEHPCGSHNPQQLGATSGRESRLRKGGTTLSPIIEHHEEGPSEANIPMWQRC